MDLRRFVDIVVRRAGIILVTLAAAVVGAYAVYAALPPSYSATAIVRIPAAPFGSEWRQYDLGYADRRMNTLASVAETDRVRGEVARRVGLTKPPHLQVEVVANTELLLVVARGPTPHAAAEAANVATQVLIDLAGAIESDAGVIGPPPEMVEAARPPARQRGPSLPLVLVLAAAAGALAGLLLAFVAENLDERLYDADDIAAALRHPVLVRVPRFERWAHQKLVPPHSSAGHAYRRLRSHLLAFGGAERPRTVLVAATSVGAGASTTVANLAKSLADGGWWVVVVDIDADAPKQRALLGAEAPAAGREPERRPGDRPAPLRTRVRGVTLVNATPAEVPDILASLRYRAHVVLVDAGALSVTGDAAFLGSVVDGVLLTVPAGRVRPQDLEDARVRLASVDARVLGAVVTCALGRGKRSAPRALDAPHSRLDEAAPPAREAASGSAGAVRGRS